MATVRITDTIRKHVRNKINQMFEDRSNAAHAALQALPIADAAYEDTYSSEVLSLVDQLIKTQHGADWFNEYHDVYVRIPLGPESTMQPDKVIYQGSFTTRAKFRTRRPIPAGRSWTTDFHLKLTNPLYPAAHAAVMEIKRLENEREKLVTTLVDGVLTECTTLRQVLELWPTAMEFMSNEVKKRHAEPTTKRGTGIKAAEVSVEVKAALMTARMLSTNRS